MAFAIAPTLLKIPKEIIMGICYFLEPKDTISLSLTCNSAYLTIHNNPIIWRFYCHKFGFVQNKKGKKWCFENAQQIPANKRDDLGDYRFERNGNNIIKNLNSKRNTHMPIEEVEAYSIEFGNEDNFLKILEYNWWDENNHKITLNQGKKPVSELDNSELENIRLDISLATELVNWRLVFYMNILNEDPNHIFWLRIGTCIDIMTPITSVKIDPKIYQDMEDTVISRIFDFAKKIKYLSTLHTCRHFIRLPCPIRIREILIGGRIGNIISSEPNSHGRYLLELPKELVHMVNVVDIPNPKCDNDNLLGSKKLQLPINIHRKSFLGNYSKIITQSKMEGTNLGIPEEEKIEEEEEDRDDGGIMYKVASSSIEFVTIANAFISYASNPNWTTSLTPRSISAFKQVGIPNNEGFQLFSEVLSQMHKDQKGVKGEIRFGAVNDYYSNMNLTHSPVNCTTPCSVINRTCNLEFQNIRQYFKMLCSNSIIFNMFATSINLQDSAFDNDQSYSCWCEYPKTLLGCTWYYNPNRSNLQDIRNFNSGIFSSLQNSSLSSDNLPLSIAPKANLELILNIIQNPQGLERQINRRYITLNKEEACMADLIYLIKANLDGVICDGFKDEHCYNIFILKGIGWRKLSDYENEENEDSSEIFLQEKEMGKKVYGENLTKNEKILSKLKSYSGDLLGSLSKNFFFVNGEKIKAEIKQIGTEEIYEDLKEQFKIHKEFIIPISWSSDGLRLSKISFLPIKVEEEHDFVLKSNIDNTNESLENQFIIQRSFSGISNMSTMPSFSSFSSLEGHMLNSTVKFSKCRIITLYRELNRFKDHKEYSGDISLQNPESKDNFCLKSLIKNTNEIYKDLIVGKFYGDISSRFLSFDSQPIQNTLYFDSISNSENTRLDDSFKEDLIIKNQYKFTLLQSSQDTRQFEFHSDRSDIILIGTSLGKVKLIDRYNDVILAEQGKFT
ncbi:hypothetical protein CPHLJ_2g3620 [Cryptosporidium parvum]